MKLRGMLLTIALIPVLVVCATLGIYVSVTSSKSLKAEIEMALRSTVYAVRDDYKDPNGNNYHVDDKNYILYNGDWNITEDCEALDLIKKETGIVTTIFYGNTRYSTSVTDEKGKRAIGTTAGDTVVNRVIKNQEEFFAENVDVNGEPHFAYYIPLYDNVDGKKVAVGMVFAGKPQSDVNAEINSLIMGILFVALGVVAVALVAVVPLSMSISKRFQSGVEVLGRLGEGDLTVSVDSSLLTKKDETGDIARSVATLKNKLSDVLGDIIRKSSDVDECAAALGEASEECANSVEQVEHAVNEIAEGATSQAADTTSATEKVILMGELVEQTNESLEKLYKVSDEMESNGKAAAGTLDKLVAINDKAKSAIEIIYEQTNTTNESAKKISEAVSLITSIAEETNLLSLNASIEAARAGEMGRGFAVVAGQISKLAEQSNESAHHIEEIVTSLMEDSAKAVSTMDEVKVIMNDQSDKVIESGNTFKQVIEEINVSRDNVKEIAGNMEELNKSRQSVTDIVSNLSAIAEENAASTEETSASATEVAASIQEISANAAHLKEIAANLQQTVSIFKI